VGRTLSAALCRRSFLSACLKLSSVLVFHTDPGAATRPRRRVASGVPAVQPSAPTWSGEDSCQEKDTLQAGGLNSSWWRYVHNRHVTRKA
jgi:hypothetical protein